MTTLAFVPTSEQAAVIARKLAGPERSAFDDGDLAFHEREYHRLRGELEAVHGASTLPEVPTARSALHDLLVRLRLGLLGQESR